ncbi:hypothetical protein LU699_16570 [Luteimonas fraxinea]|uniref:hypothetical protein n=1 Tax=Luteimonas fraxinea TaxID=2901869 RepID=UPI001E4C62C7|nr:hypothetical protein [Luteimonas fraxinea]UHH09848.1 hypothetical protein LU699_16570 [Luteimonas fraxinea]
MSSEKHTLGKAIDILLAALEPLDEASRETAIIAVCRQLNLAPVSGALFVSDPLPHETPAPQLSLEQPIERRSRVDIRSFKEQKKPRTAREMACVTAFYLQELAGDEERKDSISTTDLEKYFKQAGYKLPTRMAQLLVDAKAAGYFESTGRGEYKLNAVGYNLVEHNLPGEG